MLDEFCNGISDKAQLKIALRLTKAALPVWNDYFSKHPNELKNLNDLIGEPNKVAGGAKQIDVQFPEHALRKIENSFIKAEAVATNPIPLMKQDVLLSPLLATSFQPITNQRWGSTLTLSVRLVYTAVWNILVWLQLKRLNDEKETHIYIAINQAADALMRENLLTTEEINGILLEYQSEIRDKEEDAAWENAVKPKETGYEMNEIYLKITGQKIVKDPPVIAQTKEILRQMREEDKSFWDKWEEYYSGTCKTYSFNKEKNSYFLTEVDIIVASFYNEYPMTEKEMTNFISGISIHDLRGSGFEI